MREFFKGWRRKTGLSLLAMAMLLTVAWFRSVGIRDSIDFDISDTHHFICSSESMLTWFRNVNFYEGKLRWSSESLAPRYRQKAFMLDVCVTMGNETNWRTVGVGYRGGKHFAGGTYFHQWGVQYWLFVLPLTVFSAILLLIKPHPSTSIEAPKTPKHSEETQ